MRSLHALVLIGLGVSLVPAWAEDCADTRGAGLFSRCAVCHARTAGEHLAGPSLAALRGRKAGTVAGFEFSPALRASGWVWDEATLDRFLKNPQAALPGAVMPFGGMRNDGERAALVCFLLQEK